MEGRLADAAWEIEIAERNAGRSPRKPREPEISSDRAKLEAVAKGYRELEALRAQQRETTAKMIRACTARLKSPDSRKRAEAVKALDDLAAMMETSK